ncbi:MAG TPA: DUF2510 domain-containing protein [Pseudolysinimonas sp.]|nr:DUF2510 domain-containing protein [Pseudolysinimonas sp.]
MTNSLASAPPGWYPDPSGQAPQRWWSGTQWTPHVNSGVPSELGVLVPISGWATRSLVWGIVAVVIPLAALPGILALVFGVLGMSAEKRNRDAGMLSKLGRARAGTILGAVSLGFAALVIVLAIVYSR